MRIAHVITRFIPGGADENTALTCNHQARNGDQVMLISGRAWSERIRAQLDPAVEFQVVPALRREIAPQSDLKALLDLIRVLRAFRPDIVHTHTSKAGILGRIAARIVGAKTIVHSVHTLAFFNASWLSVPLFVFVERVCGTFTNLFVHVSPAMQDECRRRRIGRSAIHVVAESGMDIGRYANAQQPEDAQDLLKSPVGPDQKPFVLLNVARLEKGKGQRELLNAVRHIVEQHSNIVLLLAGEGQDRKAIEQEISSLGLEKHVRLLGHREDVERLLAIADVLPLPRMPASLTKVGLFTGISANFPGETKFR